jgi:hypothetical protein
MAETNFILEGILMVALVGTIASICLHVLETITEDGYVPKKERLRRAALLESQESKKHGKIRNKK